MVTAAQPRASLRSDFAINLIGYVGYAAALWAVLLVLVRLGSPAMVGEYSLALAIGAPVIMFTNLRLAFLLSSDAARARSFADYFSLRIVANAVALAVIVIWATLGGYRGATWVVIVAIGASKIAEAFSDLVYAYLGMRLRFRDIAISLAVRGWGTVLAIVGLRLARVELPIVSIVIATWWFLAFWMLDLRLLRRARDGDASPAAPPTGLLGILRAFRFDAGLLRLAVQAIPLGVVAVSLSLASSIPRLTIAKHMGAEAVGYFSALAYVTVAARMIAVALGTSTLPRLGQHVANGDRHAFLATVARVVSFGVALGAIGVLVSLVAGRDLLALVYGADYAARAPVLTVLLLASGLGYVANFLEDALVAMRHLIVQGVLLVVTLLVIVVSCSLLVPEYGLIGASWALLIGAGVEVLGAGLLFWRAIAAWPAASATVPASSLTATAGRQQVT
jgi:O-antigen/teichoic acid export membrane protein